MSTAARQAPALEPSRRRPRHSVGRPRVSVVVPCFNYEQYLRGCVDSALGQPGVEVDVIIVDDRSTDASLALARQPGRRRPAGGGDRPSLQPGSGGDLQ